MNYKKYNDYELVYKVKECDEVSHGILLKKYLPIIKKIASDAYKGFGCYGYDYDDFLQEGYIGFQNAVINFNETKNILFYSFVVLCIKRHMLSFCRNISNGTKNIANYNLTPLDDVVLIDPSNDIDSYIDKSFLVDSIKNLIYSLSFESSCILELKINGFTYKEIGVLLDMPSSTVEYKNRKSKKMLLNMLSKLY